MAPIADTSFTAPASTRATADIRLLIFGLPPDCSPQDVRGLLHHCGIRLGDAAEHWAVDLAAGAGELEEIIATVHHLPDRLIAARLADGLRRRRFHGRALQGWVPLMDWS